MRWNVDSLSAWEARERIGVVMMTSPLFGRVGDSPWVTRERLRSVAYDGANASPYDRVMAMAPFRPVGRVSLPTSTRAVSSTSFLSAPTLSKLTESAPVHTSISMLPTSGFALPEAEHTWWVRDSPVSVMSVGDGRCGLIRRLLAWYRDPPVGTFEKKAVALKLLRRWSSQAMLFRQANPAKENVVAAAATAATARVRQQSYSWPKSYEQVLALFAAFSLGSVRATHVRTRARLTVACYVLLG